MSDRSKGKTANQPPVSAHPAFPVIVALWFAALCGIGSMVLPLDMFERASVSTGLADAYAAAQPPLGATARIAVAVLAALIGGAAGVFVAGRVRAANAPRSASRRAAALQPTQTRFSAKRPISAHEELGEGGLDADEDEALVREGPTRRRALAVADDSAPSDFLSFAPLPGRSANEVDEPLDLVAFEEPAAVEEPVEAGAESDDAPFARGPEEFGSSILSPAAAHPFDHRFAQGDAEEGAPFAQEISLARSEDAAPGTAGLPDAGPAVLPVGERALSELGTVELVERFALALQRHQTAGGEASVMAPAREPVAQDESVAFAEIEASDETAQERGAFGGQAREVSPPVELPDALRPFGFEDTEEDAEDEADAVPDLDLAAAMSQSREPFSAPFPSALDSDFAEDEDESDEYGIAADSYPSLLAMKSPNGHREPVRIDDADQAEQQAEPVVVFPGQAARRVAPAAEESSRPFDAPRQRAEDAAAAARHPAPDAHATERALREALEKLQRMSGAA